MKNTNVCFVILLNLCFLIACKEEKATLFTRMSSNETGVTFNNLLQEDNPDLSILNYPYFYNGGGVAIGDVNNDGLQDIMFTGNMVKNALYLNKGNFEFEDITAKSGLFGFKGWSTGVTIVDINNDGLQDIYICRSALPHAADRKNLLFINNGNLHFTEQAAQYGLDDSGYSTQASFFDYDRDGDLDLFLINQSDPKYSRGNLDYIQNRFEKGDSLLSNKLYRNDLGHFVDASRHAGITSNIFSYSLGLSTSDINQDGWPDIYVGNDFEEADYLFINNHDGTFTDELAKRFDHTSLFSMGVDVADFNNDLLPDMIQVDMLPEDNYQQKMHLAGDNYNRYTQQFKKGMFPQYMKNSLQKNNGDGTFSEIGQLTGTANTNWSWSPLFADFDNDGLKDLFITNGYQRDNTDMQFIVYAMDQSQHIQQGGRSPTILDYISHMPGISLPNYIYKNKGDDHFENKVKEWGLDHATFSNGAAYADLDNDGDLDLVINNTGEKADLYRNNSEKLLTTNFLRIRLIGNPKNKEGIGSRIYVYAGTDRFYLEQNPVRGYQSSSDKVLHFGLGSHAVIDSLRIIWPDQNSQLIKQVNANQTLELKNNGATPFSNSQSLQKKLLTEEAGLDFRHKEFDVNDFGRQFLLPHSYSHSGPCLAQGDVNGDGLADIFIGGGKGQRSAILRQLRDGTFAKINNPDFEKDTLNKTMDAAFFDADGDNDLDLYLVSGGYECDENSAQLQDRLYLNNGKGIFAKSEKSLEVNYTNKKCVRPVDFDNDGDIDLFVAGNIIPGRFPLSSPSKIYFNDGKGNFNITQPGTALLGAVNDAVWIDLDKDGRKDLIISSEWMPLRAFKTQAPLFADVSQQWFPFASDGWWNCIAQGDFDNDGDIDLIVGNNGLNGQLKTDPTHPLHLFYSDFDGNGSIDPIITYRNGNDSVPLPLRDDLIGQIPSMKKKFNDYNVYASAKINDVLPSDQLLKSPSLHISSLKTMYLENTGKEFTPRELPVEAQYAPVYAIGVADFNRDGNLDFVLAGNNSKNRIYLGRDDANHGQVFLGNGKNGFSYLSQDQSGLNLHGDARSLLVIGNDKLVIGMNNARSKIYSFK